MTVPAPIDYSMDADFDAALRRRTTFSTLMRPDVTADEPFLSTFYVSTDKSDQREKSKEDGSRHVYIDVKARRAYFEATCQDRYLPEANYLHHDHVKFQVGDGYQGHLTTEPIVARRLRACEEGSEHASLVSAEESAKKASSDTVQEDKPQGQHQVSTPADTVAAQLIHSQVEDPYDLVLLSLSDAFAKESPSVEEMLSLSEAFATESPSIDGPPLVTAVVLEDKYAVPADVVATGCSLSSPVPVFATKIEAKDRRALPVEVKKAQPSFNKTCVDDAAAGPSGCSPLIEVFECAQFGVSLLINTFGDCFKDEQPLSKSAQSSVEKGADEATSTQGCSLIETIEPPKEESGLLANEIADVLFPFKRSPRSSTCKAFDEPSALPATVGVLEAESLLVDSATNLETADTAFAEVTKPAREQTQVLMAGSTGNLEAAGRF